jgi:hypothetical protein
MGIEDLEEKDQVLVSWSDMGKRVLRPLEIMSNIFLLLILGSGIWIYFVKDLKIIITIMLSIFVYVGLFIYYKKRLEKVKRLIYQWGAEDVYQHFYPEEFEQRFGKGDIDNSLYKRESNFKNRLSKIEEITKKYENE